MSLDFIRYRKDLLVPLFLLFVSAGALFYNSYRSEQARLNPFSRLILTVISYPQRIINGAVDGVADYWHRYADLRDAREENELLKDQMDGLQMTIQRLTEETARLKMGLGGPAIPDAQLLNASVIGLSPREEYRVVTVNRGSEDGVRYGMPAVIGVGLVGKVVGAGNSRNIPGSNSQVLLLVDPRCRVDALVYRFTPNSAAPAPVPEDPEAPPQPVCDCPWDPANWKQTRARGVVQGAQDKLILKFVSRDAEIKVGDRVVSSGLGGIFPKGLLIGTVSMVDPAELELSPRIEVAPAVTFANLEEIQIMLTKGSPIQ